MNNEILTKEELIKILYNMRNNEDINHYVFKIDLIKNSNFFLNQVINICEEMNIEFRYCAKTKEIIFNDSIRYGVYNPDLLEKKGASVSIKRKVVGQYFYKCDDCSKVIKCYVDERLIKEQRPTPFMDTCPCCKGTIKDDFGYITLSNIEEIEIKEFNKDIPIAVYLLTDADLKNYKDMACGNLHIVKNGKLVSVHK